MPPGPRSSTARHRPLFHALVLAAGFVVGGVLTELGRIFLPTGAVKRVLTLGVAPSLGPLKVDLVLIAFSVGPVVIDVSVLGVLGILIAYLIARSLF